MRFTMTFAVIALLALGAGVSLAACGSDSEEEVVDSEFAVLADAPDGYEGVTGEATLERSEDGTEASLEVAGLEPDTEYVGHVHAASCDQADPGGPHYKFDPDGSDMPPNEIHFSFTTNAQGEGEAEASNDRRIPDGDAGSIVIHVAEPEEDGDSMAAGGEAMEHEGDDAMEHEGGDAMGHEGGGHSHSDKIACAELEGGTAPEEASSEGDAMKNGDAMKHDGDAMEHEGGGAETIVVRDGEPVGGVAELEYGAGEVVAFRVRSDVADEVHVHGYDLSKDVDAGGTVSFSFPAELEGIFEVELEERAEQIAELRVNP